MPPLPAAVPLEVEVDLDTPRKEEPKAEEESFFDAIARRVRELLGSDRAAGGAPEQTEQTELERLRQERTCVECWVAPRAALVLSCSHLAMCRSCAEQQSNCPVCRRAYPRSAIRSVLWA